ncbi:thermonuclease family protein [Brevibacterium jeotgali]|nr:thermonuclease family protein [Brevibacterium jeotgali]
MAGLVVVVPLAVAVTVGLFVLPLFPSAQATETVAVVRVIDGDTIIVNRDNNEERVRILGIDAPEVARDGAPGEECAAEATALTEELTAGRDVVTTTDPSQSETDRYGRTLAYVEADGQDVGAELLTSGLAKVYESATDIARYADYERLGQQAEPPPCMR